MTGPEKMLLVLLGISVAISLLDGIHTFLIMRKERKNRIKK